MAASKASSRSAPPPAKTPLKQRSIASFFPKSSPANPSSSPDAAARPRVPDSSAPNAPALPKLTSSSASVAAAAAASSKPADTLSSHDALEPAPPSSGLDMTANDAESSQDDEQEEPVLKRPTSRRLRRRSQAAKRVSEQQHDSNDSATEKDHDGHHGSNDSATEIDDLADFVVSDDSQPVSRKRKRNSKPQQPRKKSTMSSSSPPPELPSSAAATDQTPPLSTAAHFAYTADAALARPVCPPAQRAPPAANATTKFKAHTKDPEERYPWLATVRDKDKRPPGHADYDARSIYIPPMAWAKFSPFEKQYWAIKQNLWDTIVFFKKGKFYELYEHDATVGHQLFDLKMTDRVNMRMVGVPESSLDHWVNQFVAKQYKVARVDQMETNLAKEMRERHDTPGKKQDKIISRELACILTGGTLVDGSMLQDDMAAYCVAIKEGVADRHGDDDKDDAPAFGVAFADTATGRFFLSAFVDDADRTRLETLVAQTAPRELVLERSRLSPKSLAVLKRNAGPSTIWTYLKPGTEFWDADTARSEVTRGKYFAKQGGGGDKVKQDDDNDDEVKQDDDDDEVKQDDDDDKVKQDDDDDKVKQDDEVDDEVKQDDDDDDNDNDDNWPQALKHHKHNNLVMSAFGALVSYLKFLKLERPLLSQANFAGYDPIETSGTLVLDGQTLANLEIFCNSATGGAPGTLFHVLNRCVTPFGKRLLRQWVAHPLCDARRINERLDAVEMLNADVALREQLAAQLVKMPDLERLISRIHAGACRPPDFVRVLDGFEQLDAAMGLVGAFAGGCRLVDRLAASMPRLAQPLGYWKTAFDRDRACRDKLLIPQRGIDAALDASTDAVARLHRQLDELLAAQRAQLKCSAVKYADVGKEIYQLEVPKSVRVPPSWRQMSATRDVKRWYFGPLAELVRQLREADETHSQRVRHAAARLFARFDADHATWRRAVHVVAQLDCLLSLARASSGLGQPVCRPRFVDEPRSRIEFEELRHPCMLGAVDDFIPNSVALGGDVAKMSLLTGANAAGKSTILRMTCVAVIMAQVGCLVPAVSARLTPVDRIMSRLGANDHIFAAQSTFFVELTETNKILRHASPRSLVILDELGRGTSSSDGVAVAHAVLHHVASHVGCLGFFATHYHSLAAEFAHHPEVRPQRMQIAVRPRHVVFLYRLEPGVAPGSFGMHCAAMCGIAPALVDRAEVAARRWEHTSRLAQSLDAAARSRAAALPLGVLSDVAALLGDKGDVTPAGLALLLDVIDAV